MIVEEPTRLTAGDRRVSQNVYSNFKIFAFPEKIASFREGRIAAPIYVRIKPTNRCMHACHWCVYSDGTKRPKDRPAEHLQSAMHETMDERAEMGTVPALELLYDLKAIGTKAVTFSGGGEPLGHPGIVEMFLACECAHLDYSIITNGQLLSGERAQLLAESGKWVRISMDYADAAGMAKSRNVSERFFGQVIENLERFARMKRPDCNLDVNFIVTRENHLELMKAAELLAGAGVERIRFSPVYCQNFIEYHSPIRREVLGQLAEIRLRFGSRLDVNSTYEIESPSKSPNRPFHRCLYAQTVPVVGADLNVYACHNTAYSEHGRLGSIRGRSFSEFWFSPECRAALEALNPSVVCRHECANHAKVALFEEIAGAAADNFV